MHRITISTAAGVALTLAIVGVGIQPALAEAAPVEGGTAQEVAPAELTAINLTAPVVTQPVGELKAQGGKFVWVESSPGTITTQAADGGMWSLDNGAPVAAYVQYALADGTHTVTFTPNDGYKVGTVSGGGYAQKADGTVSFTVTLTRGADGGAAKVTVAKAPYITGTAQVGKVLTANVGAASPAGAKLSYQWLANGTAIAGATAKTYTPASAAQLGKRISVRVTAATADYTSYVATSAQTVAVKAGALTAPVPTISGTVRVAKSLTAKPGTWTSGTALKYQWYLSGKPISGATRSTLGIASGYYGKTIQVRVTGTKSGYTTVVKASKATSKVAKGTLTGAVPTITGSAVVGKTLAARAGAWTGSPKLTYQWYANSSAIKGATKSTFKIPANLRGKTIYVRVTGTRVNFTTLARNSARTGAVIETKAWYAAHSGNRTTYKVVVTGLQPNTKTSTWGDVGEADITTWYPTGDWFNYSDYTYTGAASYTKVYTLGNKKGITEVDVWVYGGYDANFKAKTATAKVYAKPTGAPDIYYSLVRQASGTSFYLSVSQ